MANTNILLLGADGFIGRHIAFYLRIQGYRVVCSARNTAALARAGFETFQADLTNPAAATPGFWENPAADCDVIINAAGLLNGTDSQMQAVHIDAPAALYSAAKKHRVSKLILISAIGIEADTPFGATKSKGESAVKNSTLPYVILRPSLVLADTSYGGSSLLRALSALPFITPTIGTGAQEFNPIHANELAKTVEAAFLHDKMDDQTVFPCGPERVTQKHILAALQAWLGRPKTRHIAIPLPLAHIFGWIGDRLKLGPISKTAVTQIEQGVSADYTAFHKQSGIKVRGFSQILNARPAGAQDLWHARLYILRPVVRFALMFMWLLSGLVGLSIPPEIFLSDMAALGLSDTTLITIARGAGIMDIGIALGLLLAWKLPYLALLQLLIVAVYTIIFGLVIPILWLEPYGGLLKNIPVLLLILIHHILEVER
ncbi:MAG: SDR family oxidoreductase [Paracoccaceae bacterium]